MFESISKAWMLFTGGFRVLSKHKILLVPLVPVYLLALLLAIFSGFLLDVSAWLFLFSVFIVAFSLLFSFSVSSAMLKQINEKKDVSLGKALKDASSKTLGKIFLLTLVWFTVAIILMILEAILNALLRRVLGDDGAESISRSIFGPIGTAIRMMAFMMVPIFVFEKKSFGSSFSRMKEVLSKNKGTFFTGLVLTQIVTFLVGIIVIGALYLSQGNLIVVMIALLIASIGWFLSVYIEQMFVAAMFLSYAKPGCYVSSMIIGEVNKNASEHSITA